MIILHFGSHKSHPPDSLRVAARLDHGEGLRSAPVPEVQLVVGGDQEELGSRVEGQGGDGNIALCEPTLTAALQRNTHSVNQTHTACFENALHYRTV